MNFEQLNLNINGNRVSGFEGDNEVFEKIGTRLNAKLPKDYTDFIRVADGGHPEAGTFFLDDGRADGSFTVDWFYTFSNSNIENIETALNRWGNVLGRLMLPIARDPGGNQFYLNLNDAVPSVWIYLHDSEKRIKLADNLTEFLSALTVHPDFT